MEAGGRAPPDHLTHLEELTDHPGRFHLFHALRIIEAAYPDAPRLGESGLPREDPVRLGQLPELAFPPSTVAEFKPGGEKVPGVLKNRFFGLFGPHGPLPLHFTEYARDRLRNHRDPTMVAFADMLTHRAMSLLYRAWSSAEPAASFDADDWLATEIEAFAPLVVAALALALTGGLLSALGAVGLLRRLVPALVPHWLGRR